MQHHESPSPDPAPERARPAGRPEQSPFRVRELVAQLTEVEEALRQVPFFTREEGLLAVNPEIAALLVRQRALVSELRRRRTSWLSGSPRAAARPLRPRPPWA